MLKAPANTFGNALNINTFKCVCNKILHFKPFPKIPKGELTLVISENITKIESLTEVDKKKIKKMIKNNTIKDIVKLFVEKKKISKKEVYNYCLSIKK